MEKSLRPNRRVVNNFYGNINHFYQGPVSYFGEVTNNNERGKAFEAYTDAQVARAIEAICGEDKALDTKQKWAGVYWLLRWQCNYPVKGTEFCERIKRLPFTKPLRVECDYNNMRRFMSLSFMNKDARQVDEIKPNKNDELAFAQCRAVVLALSEELSKQAKKAY